MTASSCRILSSPDDSNRLGRLLSVFDQEYRQADSEHYLEINDEHLDDGVKCVVHRLLKAAAAPNVRRAMEKTKFFFDIEDRDTAIMIRIRKLIRQEQLIEQKEQVIEQKEQVIEQKEQVIRSMIKMLCKNGTSIEEISKQLSMPVELIKQYID